MNENMIALKILKALFDNEFSKKVGKYEYEEIDDFYGFLGYDLEIERELQALGIQGTSDLQIAFEDLV